ncbi:MAG: T9SS type A sorting domain-containing protein [Ferruginibacter sp.]
MKNFTHIIVTMLCLMATTQAFSQPRLNSLPSSSYTIYLDFDGQPVQSSSWNGGVAFTCLPSGMNDAQITEIFNRVSEDYRPFNINITTEETKFLSAPLTKRIRIIITPTSAWRPGVGGISYVGSFTWGDDTPGFVFCDRLGPNYPKYVAECCTHESGHTVGLSHQSSYDNTCALTATYNLGVGTGETSWAPVMGNSYYKNMTTWNNGPTPYGCTSTQDNLTIITSQNGFSYRTDDFGETLGTSTYTLTSNSFSQAGIITTTLDKDAFKFSVSQNSSFHFEANPYAIALNDEGSNLDIMAQLYDASKTLIRTYNPANAMNIIVDTTLNTGTYYIVLTGTGNVNIGEYGSLGSYSITGLSGALPIHDVTLNGSADKNKHALSWNIIADEPIKTQVIEVSEDGINFKTLYNTAASAKSFTYAPYQTGNLYYRLKVTSVLDQTVYSNVIVLKASANADNQYYVSTLVKNEIMVNASQNYNYRLSDVNGRVLSSGNGLKGINKIDISNKASGMYIIQLINNNQIQSERIIKQ